jgi:tRNA(fMet)-specific endonuclease VapC
MIYSLDTNILVHYLRESPTMTMIDDRFNPLGENHVSIISTVVLGELHSLALQNKWGSKRLESIEKLLQKLVIVDIHADDIIKRYAEIDAFSQSKHEVYPLPVTARNMGKNDLWIAATSSVLEATLLTTDTDFAHLDPLFLRWERL